MTTTQEMKDRKFSVIAATVNFEKGKGLVLHIGDNTLLLGSIDVYGKYVKTLAKRNTDPNQELKTPDEVVQVIMDYFMDAQKFSEPLNEDDMREGRRVLDSVGATLNR